MVLFQTSCKHKTEFNADYYFCHSFSPDQYVMWGGGDVASPAVSGGETQPFLGTPVSGGVVRAPEHHATVAGGVITLHHHRQQQGGGASGSYIWWQALLQVIFTVLMIWIFLIKHRERRGQLQEHGCPDLSKHSVIYSVLLWFVTCLLAVLCFLLS